MGVADDWERLMTRRNRAQDSSTSFDGLKEWITVNYKIQSFLVKLSPARAQELANAGVSGAPYILALAYSIGFEDRWRQLNLLAFQGKGPKGPVEQLRSDLTQLNETAKSSTWGLEYLTRPL